MEKKIICPGDKIKEQLIVTNYNQRELAEKLELDLKTTNEILNGKAPITIDSAKKLEYIFNLDASYWNKLEFEYRTARKLEQEKSVMEKEYKVIKNIYSELAERKIVSQSSEKTEIAINYRRFMEITHLEQLETKRYQLERYTIKDETIRLKLLTWAQIGMRKIREQKAQEFKREKIMTKIENIKKLLKMDYEQVENELLKMCNSCGIYFNIEENIKGASIWGYSKWLTPERPFIQLAKVENNDVQKLIHNFLYELSHILLGKKKIRYYDSEAFKIASSVKKDDKEMFAEEEIKGHKFAKKYLGINED